MRRHVIVCSAPRSAPRDELRETTGASARVMGLNVLAYGDGSPRVYVEGSEDGRVPTCPVFDDAALAMAYMLGKPGVEGVCRLTVTAARVLGIEGVPSEAQIREDARTGKVFARLGG